MTDNDYKDKLLEDFFAANRHEVADDGFTRRVMHRLPQRHNRLAQAWNVLCILLVAVLFVAMDGVQLVWATLRETFIGLVEPLRSLFKDEVRALGRKLHLPDSLVNRQPFPGPGLAIRVIGEVTREKLDILREADAVWRQEIEKAKVKADQYFAVLTDLRSVGVVGDFRTYDYTLALRAVRTSDFMTAEYAKVPHAVLDRAATRIANEVKGVGRVVYDITGKPPATVEWE